MEDDHKFEDATALLEAIVEDRTLLAELDVDLRKRFLTAAGRVSKPDMESKRKLYRKNQWLAKNEKRKEDRAMLEKAGIRKLRENPIFQTPRRRGETTPDRTPIGSLHEKRVCYVCQSHYQEVHFFYDQM